MRSRLRGQWRTGFAREAQSVQPVCRRQMNDVRMRFRLPHQREHTRDRFILRLARPRGEIAGVRTSIAFRPMDVLRQLRMNEQRRACSAQRVQGLFQSGSIEKSKLRYA